MNGDFGKVALVQDWLTGMRGGEKVLEVLCELFPEADLFTLIHNPGSVSEVIERRRIFTSFINRLPGKRTRYRYYLPLFPTAIELFNFKEYDLILSTSHCVAKGVRTPPGTVHISYIHTPMRYVWDMYEEYFGPDKIGPLQRLLIPFFASYLRMWDVTSSHRVDHFIANSRHVARRIWRYYRREATVIHPPVDTETFRPGGEPGDYYLMITALVPYKRVDLAIRVFNRLGRRLIIIGSGPDKKRLQSLAEKNVEFLDWLPSQRIVKYAAGCRALIFPGEEDFGIVPLEVQSCGRPVVAYGRGGALETVIPYDGSNPRECTGVFFHEQTETALEAAIRQCESVSWDSRFIRRHAEKFGKSRFVREISEFIHQKTGQASPP